MGRDKPLAGIVNKPQQVRAPLGIEIDLAMAQKEDRIHIAEARAAARRLACGHLRVAGNDVRICADIAVVEARGIPQFLNYSLGVRDIVLGNAVAGIGPDEQPLLARRRRGGRPLLRLRRSSLFLHSRRRTPYPWRRAARRLGG